MIAQLDDTSHVGKESIKSYPDYDFALLRQMCWSKNVYEERDAPDQILFGAMDTKYCVLLALVVHLEAEGSTPTNKFIFGIGGEDKEKGPERMKNSVYNCLRRVFKHDDLQHVAQNLGSHSFRKFPATLARKKGCSFDNVDGRGRWWNKVRTSDVYMDISLPYNDAKVTAKLCVGGVIKYELRENAGVSKQWIGENVIPLIASFMSKENVETLGVPLLWAVYDDEFHTKIPTGLCNTIREHFLAAGGVANNSVIPVQKVLLSISGSEGGLYITTIRR